MPNMRAFRSGIRALAFLGVLAATAGLAHATDWPRSDIPPDPAVTFGTLSNGMRYAIMRSGTPSDQISIRFRIAAGSMQEALAQRGLAHFLEHMAFRGSAHLADGEINKTLERLGARFGADTNASTGQEETIYQFDIPKSDDQTIDTALGITREIASNLSIDPAAAQTEAGVVLSELKLRDSPASRALQAQLNFMLQDAHATALPNGDPAIIAQAPVAQMRAFYQAYYRPERATLVIVGDLDPARVEAKIKQNFTDWRGLGTKGRDPDLVISRSRDLDAETFAEPRATNRILLAWVRPPDRTPERKSDEKASLIQDIGLGVINRRFRDYDVPVRPFTRAGVSRESVFKDAELTTFSIGYEPGQWRAALDTTDRIRLGVLRSGVTQAEVDRVVADLRNALENASSSADTRPSRGIANSILREVSADNVYTSPTRDLAALNEDVAHLTADDVNRALRDLFRAGGPLIFLSGTNDIEGGKAAVKTAFLEIEKSIAAEPSAPAEAASKVAWTFTNFGTPGTVAEKTEIPDLGVTFIRFTNGVRLTVRPSKLHINEVLVSVKIGGGRLDLPKDRVTAAWATGMLTEGGLATISYADMQRALTGKNYRASFGMGEDGFNFSGQTTPRDIDTQLQVFAAYVQSPGFRPEAFERGKSSYAAQLLRAGASPAATMRLMAPQFLHDGDKRWAFPSAEEAQVAKPEELRALLTPAFANGAIDMTIVGDITVDQAVQSVAATFGAFSSRPDKRVQHGPENATHFPTERDVAIKIVTAGQTEQQIASVIWPTHGRFPDIKEQATLQLMSDIMEQRLFDRLRGIGTVYVAQVSNASSEVFDYGYVQALAQLSPGESQKFQDALDQIVGEMIEGKWTEDDLARAKLPALQEARKARETNGYWLSVLDRAQEDPNKLALARTYAASLESVTKADIVAAARRFLDQPRAIKLTVGP